MATKLFSCLFLFILIHLINGRPDGAPVQACMNMIPNHQGIQPLSIPAPFAVVADKTVILPGETLTVSLSTIAGKFRYFKGFLIVAVTPDNFMNKIGTFATNHEKYVGCGSSPYSAVTHSSPSLKSQVDIHWTAPKDFQGAVVFIATIVENFGNFWVGQQSQIVSVSTTGTSPVPITPVSNHLSTVAHLQFGDANNLHDLNNLVYGSVNFDKQQPSNSASRDLYEGCGITKGCYGEPPGCISTWNCITLVTFQRQGNDVVFQLMGPAGGWIALGLSKDRTMGSDSVTECVQNQQDGNVQVFTSFNHDHTNKRLPLTKGGLMQTQGSSVDGQISCSFTRQGNVVIEDITFDLINEPHYLFLAKGSVQTGTADNLQQHSIIPYRSERAVDLTSVTAVSGGKETLLFVHGCLMIIAWTGTVSVAVFMARFYKYTWVQTLSCGEQVWFTFHRALNILTIILTSISIIIIFIALGGWSSVWKDNPHPIMGLLTVILMFIQPISAALRPRPGTPKRPIFNWIHFLVGSTARVLSIATLFLAEKLQRVSLLSSYSGVLITYIVFEVGCYFIMEIYSCIKAHSGKEQIPLKELQLPPISSIDNSTQKNPDAPGSSFRKLFLVIHSIGIVALTSTLVIIVASSSDRVIDIKN